MSITALSGLAIVTGGVFSIRNQTKPLNAVLAEDNGIEPSSLSQWDGFQDRLGAMPSILRSLWRQMLIFWLLQRAAIHHNGKGIQGIRSVANSQRARLPCCRPNTLTVVAMVGGFEPPTSWLTVNRSTTELHHLRLTPSASVDLRTCGAVSPIHRCRSQQSYRFLPLVLYVFTKRLQAKTFKYSPRVEEGFLSDLIGCMESFNRCGHGAVTTMAITRRIMNPWPQRWDHWTD